MGTREDIAEALKLALKAQNKVEISTLRLILAAVKDRDIAARSSGAGADGGDESGDMASLLGKMIRQRRESADAYDAAQRPELAAQERAEIEVIRRFLPPQMEESDMIAAVQTVIGELQANSLKDMGKVMGALKQRYAGKMDFSHASCLVKKSLA